MTPTFARYCPYCGTSIQANIHQCPTCCLPATAIHGYSSGDQDQQSAGGKTIQEALPVADNASPYLDSPTEQLAVSLTPRAPLQLSSTPVSSLEAKQPTFPLTIVATQVAWVASFVHLASQSGKFHRRVNMVFVVPIFLLILGIGGYLAFTGLHWHQAPIKTVSVHIPLTYVGLSVTVNKVQQAQNFVNDPQTVDDGMVRLYLQEQNTTTIPVTWNYAQCAHLVIPGQPLLAPIYVQSKGHIAPGAIQSSVLDFVVPNGGNLSTMSLQLGTANEADVRAPLLGQIDSHQYQPQIHSQHGNMTYLGLDWSLMRSTTSLSIPGQQATQGMEYLTLALAVNNPLSQEVISGSPFDYVRAKINGQTFRPVNTTLPVSFAQNHLENGVTITFLIPQKSSSGTFLLVSQNSDGSGQASANFSLAHSKQMS